MGVARNAAAMLAANEAFNRGDAGPVKDMFADDYKGPDGSTRADVCAGFDAALGAKFEQVNVLTHGSLVLGCGRGVAPDGSPLVTGWVADFDEHGKIRSYTNLFGSAA